VSSRSARHRPAVWFDVCVKVALAASLVAVVAVPGLREFSDRGLAGRVAGSVVALAVVPAWWWLWGRRRSPHGYPFALDGVLALPFLIDLWSKQAGYAELPGWAEVAHALDFALLATAMALVLARLDLGVKTTVALVLCCGIVAAVVWELLEEVTLPSHSGARVEDSVLDLALAVAASAATAAAAGVVLARRSEAPSDA
jgi:hypothetical protein